ncbi:MAG: rRNA maturation RNase YbeY [Cyclobacteriaceae bacterium]|nr:rRNA maturation RNase YbeY [Cyclobacteriaceae bacterium]
MPKSVIQFFSERTSFALENQRKVSSWLSKVASHEKKSISDLSYIFCTDGYLLKLNKAYLHHDTYTDIITFDYSEGKGIVGEVFISISRVRENAKVYRVSFEQELRRVMAHGLLHLLGFKDKGKAEKALMREKEEACLSLWK